MISTLLSGIAAVPSAILPNVLAPPPTPDTPNAHKPSNGDDEDRGNRGGKGGRGGNGGGSESGNGQHRKGSCPPIWKQVSADLVKAFTDSSGQCNDLARAAVRIAFHDCSAWKTSLGTSAGCDGSLFLAKEYTRSENAGLEQSVPQLGAMGQKYAGIGIADFFQFAGGEFPSFHFRVLRSVTPETVPVSAMTEILAATHFLGTEISLFLHVAHAVVTCPLGPTVQTFVGRKDRSTPNPEGLLPNVRASGDSLVALFEDKGISAAELSALIGAHAAAKQFEFNEAKAGAALDTTPGIWDVVSINIDMSSVLKANETQKKFYGQVVDGTAPFILPSDIALANNSQSGPAFHSFVNNQVGWDAAFAPA
jgi:hypothetical protein